MAGAADRGPRGRLGLLRSYDDHLSAWTLLSSPSGIMTVVDRLYDNCKAPPDAGLDLVDPSVMLQFFKS